MSTQMSPSETTYNEAFELAEREAQSVLGVGLERAFEMLDRGELAGTAAEAEMRMFRFVLEQ